MPDHGICGMGRCGRRRHYLLYKRRRQCGVQPRVSRCESGAKMLGLPLQAFQDGEAAAAGNHGRHAERQVLRGLSQRAKGVRRKSELYQVPWIKTGQYGLINPESIGRGSLRDAYRHKGTDTARGAHDCGKAVGGKVELDVTKRHWHGDGLVLCKTMK
jgi:hypothetical protein